MSIFSKTMALFLSLILWMGLSFSAEPEKQKNNLSSSCCVNIQEAQTKYLVGNQYNEFIDFLDNSKDKSVQTCLDYYKADMRYRQLKYLEEKQSWDDYFSNGNTYRDQIVVSLQKVIRQTDNRNCLRPKSRLLLWQFHHGQQDAFLEQSLADLVADINVYAQKTNDPELIREVADKLLASGEKAKAGQIYKLYVDKLVSGKINQEELKGKAAGFYKEGNLELAKSIYDIYIEKAAKSLAADKFIQELFEIASLFVYKPAGFYDLAYAEKIYARIEEFAGDKVFNQETIYLRAFNLEKFRDYQEAAKYYLQLTRLYADSKYFDEAAYKIAMINVYALADINEARKYFELLAAKDKFSPQVISAFYQLGLLAQWEGDPAKAKNYYDLLLNNSKGNYTETAAQAKERLKEIGDNLPISYNLKTFLDLSLKKESALSETGRAELMPSAYLLTKGQKIVVSSSVNMPQSGCNQVQLQYLWSGDLAGVHPSVDDDNFQAAYADPGTKEINIVVVSPAGAVDRFFFMVDVY